MKDKLKQWTETVREKSVARFPERKASFETESGVQIPPVCLPNDVDYESQLGFPGAYPFTKASAACIGPNIGPCANMQDLEPRRNE